LSEIKLVVCDIAGTTVRDSGQVVTAFADTLRQYELEFSADQLRRLRGSSKRQALLEFIPVGPDRDRFAEEVYVSFRDRLAHMYKMDGVEPIDGAEEVIGELRAKGVSVALNTGFDREITALLLRSLNWDKGIVDAVVCGDDVLQGRPAPYLIFHAMELTQTISPDYVVNVGDTVMDLEAGYNARVRLNVGVLSGAHDRPTLEHAPHTHILSSIAMLPTVLGIDAVELTPMAFANFSPGFVCNENPGSVITKDDEP
jgi:phosphonatase-like hydrolase